MDYRDPYSLLSVLAGLVAADTYNNTVMYRIGHYILDISHSTVYLSPIPLVAIIIGLALL